MLRGAGRSGPVGTSATAILVLSMLVVARADVSDRTVRQVAVPTDGRISVRITNGRLTITGSARRDVRVEVHRRAPTSNDVSAMPVVVAATDGGVTIDVRQQAGGLDAALASDVTVEVPTGAQLADVEVAEGRLDLRDLSGQVSAVVRRGPITATRVTGTVRLETVIGDLDVVDARVVPGGLLRLRTFNGDVRLRLSEAPADARVLALVLNGAIQSSLPLTVKDGWGPRWAEGTFGRGEPVVSVDVVTGTITIDAPRPTKR